MKLSTRSRYGARAMLDLALYHEAEPVSIKDIAHRQEISERYLENIMSSLSASGLVIGKRGKGGGFKLARAPGQIRLGDVITVVEGSLAPVHCIDDPSKCKRSENCVTFEIWARLKTAIMGVLDSITLQDMLEMQKNKSSTKEEQRMYYI